MTTFSTIEARNAIKSVLANANITYRDGNTDVPVPIAFGNVSLPENKRPRIEFSHVMSIQTDGVLASGQRLEERGVYDCTVVVNQGIGEALAGGIAAKVQWAFITTSEIAITDAVIQIPETPSIGQFMSTDIDGRLFVTIQYIVTST